MPVLYDLYRNDMMITLVKLKKMKQAGEKITCLTAYDASFAAILEQAGVEIILVGDSLGMVIQGHKDTLAVTMENMLYHIQIVKRAVTHSMLMVDMPFLSYNTPEQALENAGSLIKAGAQIVKLEGQENLLPIIEKLNAYDIPICAHLGLRPQSIYKISGYKAQGLDEISFSKIIEQAKAFVAAGADILLLECVPASLAKIISEQVEVPVIGIGAGKDCDAQVLVLYDILAISPKQPSFSRNFLSDTILSSIKAYVKAVKEQTFPSDKEILWK